MTDRYGTLQYILSRREEESRRGLAKAVREVANRRETVSAVDRALSHLGESLKAAIDARYGEAPQSIADLIASDNRSRALSAGSEKARGLRKQAQAAVAEAIPLQQLAAKHWRRSGVRLEHINTLAKRERILHDAKISASEDDEYLERRCAVSKSP